MMHVFYQKTFVNINGEHYTHVIPYSPVAVSLPIMIMVKSLHMGIC